ncbi:MAG: hypothetical protein QOG86_1707 [Thermoleophilaceae bacterium]|nr:hypothetical protein [Thermoleophilaceae bacterium]
MPKLADLDKRLPLLADWMKSVRPGHLWGPYEIHDDFPGSDAFAEYEGVEATLRTLYDARPGRLDSKRREFRGVRSPGEMRGLQAELAFGARLARDEIPFDFGAPGAPQPDLVLRDVDLGIELTSRRADPTWDLKWHLRMALRDLRPPVRVLLQFSAAPFSIRTKIRGDLTEEIRRAVRDGEREVFCVVRPPRPGEPAITLKATIVPAGGNLWPRISFAHSADVDRLMIADAERAVVAVMDDRRKQRQGASMPTLLLVEVSGFNNAIVQGLTGWADRLAALTRPDDGFVGIGIVSVSWWHTRCRLAIAENRYADMRGLTGLRAFGRALGMPQLLDQCAS